MYTWLGIKNDYRNLIGVGSLSFDEKITTAGREDDNG